MFRSGIDGKTSNEPIKPTINIFPDSVSGYFHPLIIVGNAANQSPIAANKTALIGSFA